MLKLAALVVVGVLGWFAWRKWQGKFGSQAERSVAKDEGSDTQTASGSGVAEPKADDTELCPKCGTYVPTATAQSCGRPECPYNRNS